MYIINEILNYYSLFSLHEYHEGQYRSVKDCMEYLSEKGAELQLRTFLKIIKKFENEGFLLKVGQDGDDPIYDATYVSQNLSQEYLEYGSYHFYHHGFGSVRSRFVNSVLPVDVTKADGDKDIGTCFLINSHKLITARHCIEAKQNVAILDPYGQIVTPSKIWIPDDDSDIAMIEMNYYNFSKYPRLKVEDGEVLDEVLTMGYPPIPGFEAIQIADMSHIGSMVKVSKGKIVGENRTLWDPENYFLINAKVKDGNSGGPIINNLGYVVGMIVNIPLDEKDQEKIDHLAYGVALTGRRIRNFMSNVVQENDKVKQMKFTMNKAGFSTM